MKVIRVALSDYALAPGGPEACWRRTKPWGGAARGSTSGQLSGAAPISAESGTGGGKGAGSADDDPEPGSVPGSVLVALRGRGLLEALPAPPRGGASRKRSEHDTTIELLRLKQWLGLAHVEAWEDVRRALKDAGGLVGASLAGQVKFRDVPMAHWLELAAPPKGGAL